jgi:hypothetical protein
MPQPSPEWAERVLEERCPPTPHETLLSRVRASSIRSRAGRERFRILSDEVVPRERLFEVERAHRVAAQADVDDPRALGVPHRGVLPITEVNPATGRVRYRRAPNVASPSDTDLPDSDWRAALNGDGPSPEQRRIAAEQALKRAFEQDRLTLQETLPYRIRVAYRITRELARLKSLVGPDETLAESLIETSDSRDPWTIPTEIQYPAPGRTSQNTLARSTLRILEKAKKLPLEDQLTTYPLTPEEEPRLIGAGGLALLPPDIPLRWRERDLVGCPVKPTYDEHDDAMLKHWVGALEEISRYLGLERGAEDDPDLGRLGLIGLVDVETARTLWPNRLQLIYWEEELVAQTLEQLVSQGAPHARKWLRDQHGMTRDESTSLIRMALALAKEQTEADIEELRSVMVLRLETFIQRSQAALEPRNELVALKQLGLIQGLTKTEPEDAMAAFGQLVKRYDSQDSGFLDASPSRRALPG